MRGILFDLFETLVTESGTRPDSISSLAPGLGCEREAFRREWRARRPAALTGRLSFREALGQMVAACGHEVDDATLERLSSERARGKAPALTQIEPQILAMLDALRYRSIRLGIVSNCMAEGVTAWPRSPLARRVDCVVFSFEAGLAKPDPAIYREALGRLQVEACDAWYVGDGGDDELAGAERAGLRPFQALWFLRRWPNFQERPCASESLSDVNQLVRLVEQG